MYMYDVCMYVSTHTHSQTHTHTHAHTGVAASAAHGGGAGGEPSGKSKNCLLACNWRLPTAANRYQT